MPLLPARMIASMKSRPHWRRSDCASTQPDREIAMSLLAIEINQKIANEIRDSVRCTLAIMLTAYQQNMKRIWRNPSATPQQVLDALGTDAAELFRLGALLKAT